MEANGKIKVIKINDLAALQGMEIKKNQSYIVHFAPIKDNLVEVDLKLIQHSNSRFKFVGVVKNSLTLNLILNICGDNTVTEIYNLVDLSSDKNVTLNQNVTTASVNNHAEHITKIILDQSSSATVKHIAKAEPDTKSLKLNQKIQSLILSSKARVQMQPILQIQSQDVQCKHGSTQGFLDIGVILYLQSRGISLEYSKQLLVNVFKDKVLDQMKKTF